MRLWKNNIDTTSRTVPGSVLELLLYNCLLCYHLNGLITFSPRPDYFCSLCELLWRAVAQWSRPEDWGWAFIPPRLLPPCLISHQVLLILAFFLESTFISSSSLSPLFYLDYLSSFLDLFPFHFPLFSIASIVFTAVKVVWKIQVWPCSSSASIFLWFPIVLEVNTKILICCYKVVMEM